MKTSLRLCIMLIFVTSGFSLLAGEGQLRFIENKGQVSDQFHQPRPDIHYVVAAGKFSCHLKKQGFSYQLFQETGRSEVSKRPIDRYKRRNETPATFNFYRLDLNWLNSNPNVQILKGTELPGYENYYLAVCPKGVTEVKSFSAVTYNNLYHGIDMKWYELNGQLKYDYYVKAGADYQQIQWEIKGAERLQVSSNGELIIETPLGKLIEEAPMVFQNGKKLLATWKLTGNILSFDIKDVDQTRDLLIDPLVRAWGSYFGGSGYDELSYSHLDGFNNVYFTGATSSATSLNIATVGSHQSTYGGNMTGGPQGDALLLKMNANGVRQWSTYYGGSYSDYAGGCSSDSQGNIYMVGTTSSSNAGVISTAGAYQPSLMTSPTVTWTSDVFLAKFTPAGVRIWATYYGDSLWDWANGISVDKNDNVFISGGTELVPASTVFASPGCHQPQHGGGNMDAFVARFSSAGARMWSTYFGGNGIDHSYYCAADTLGNVYITGMTSSTNTAAMASANAHQTVYSGGVSDAYLAKFSSTGNRLWSTYYGDHTEEYGINCVVDHLNEVVLFGTTDSFLGTNFGTSGSHQPTYGGGNSEGYLAKFSASGVRRWGTYYGGTGYEEFGVGCVSKSGGIFICGRSSIGSGTAIATCGTYQDVHGGGVNDCFIAHFDSLGNRQWGSYFGGTGDEPTWSCLAADANNNIYLAGMAKASTASSVFVTTGAHQTTYSGGSYDLFLERFNACTISPPAKTSGTTACIGQVAVFQATHSCVSKWYSDPLLKNLIHTGTSYSLSIVTGDTSFYYAEESCGFNKGAEINVHAGITPTVSVIASSTTICAGETVTLTPAGANTYSWTGIIETGMLEVKPKTNTTYTLAGFSPEGCKSTSTMMVVVDPCAGLPEKYKLPLFRFFPNPVNDIAWLEVEENSNFMLYGLRGEIIWDSQTLENSKQFDFSDLPSGVYLGEVKNSSARQRFKIVVVK